jgi:hypothetical protein
MVCRDGAAKASVPRTLEHTIRALVAAHLRTLLGQAAEWRALPYLERRISSPASYREIYREFVSLFRDALPHRPAPDLQELELRLDLGHHASGLVEAKVVGGRVVDALA